MMISEGVDPPRPCGDLNDVGRRRGVNKELSPHEVEIKFMRAVESVKDARAFPLPS